MNFKSNLAPRKRLAVDLSRKLVRQFIEIPPYAKDSDTGKYLNESPYRILKELDPKDIQKEIKKSIKKITDKDIKIIPFSLQYD